MNLIALLVLLSGLWGCVSPSTKGYGFHYVDPNRAQDYAQAKLVMSEKLPVIT